MQAWSERPALSLVIRRHLPGSAASHKTLQVAPVQHRIIVLLSCLQLTLYAGPPGSAVSNEAHQLAPISHHLGREQ